MRALRILGAFLSVVFAAITIKASEANLRSGELEVAKDAEHGASARNLAVPWYYGSGDVSTVGYCIDTVKTTCFYKLYSLFCMDHGASILCCSNKDPDAEKIPFEVLELPVLRIRPYLGVHPLPRQISGRTTASPVHASDTTRDSCSKTTVYGYCPGDNDIMCCLD